MSVIFIHLVWIPAIIDLWKRTQAENLASVSLNNLFDLTFTVIMMLLWRHCLYDMVPYHSDREANMTLAPVWPHYQHDHVLVCESEKHFMTPVLKCHLLTLKSLSMLATMMETPLSAPPMTPATGWLRPPGSRQSRPESWEENLLLKIVI
jgi:hypothetical protein